MQRTGFIGGSDLADVFSLPPYGCERRLAYEKNGIPADYPFYGNFATKRGHIFEPIVAQMYQEETGRQVVRMPDTDEGLIRHPKYPFIAGHPDAFIPEVNGVAEFKVPGERAFRKIKAEGMQEGYILQLQNNLMLTNADIGIFAFLWADGVDLKHFDVPPDPALQNNIIEGCGRFWEKLSTEHQDDFPRLDPSDRRCHNCQWRTSCQGPRLIDLGEEKEGAPALVNDFPADVIRDYFECEQMAKEAEQLLDDAKARIKDVLRNLKMDAVQAPGARIYWKKQDRTTVDSKKLKANFPDIYKQCTKVSPSIPLRVFAT